MHNNWFPLKDIPAVGATYELADSSLWESFFQEFNLPYILKTPLHAELWVLPGDDGCLIRGKLSGTVTIPCCRCAEDAQIEIDYQFEEFEPFPAEPTARLHEIAPGKAHSKGRKRTETDHDRAKHKAGEHDVLVLDSDVDEEVVRISPEGRGMEINLAALAWEEFLLALPEKIFCKPDCRGLCRNCGQNLNNGACSCRQEQLDPRLEKLRSLKIGH